MRIDNKDATINQIDKSTEGSPQRSLSLITTK